MEGYTMLLDACAAAKHVVSLSKRYAQMHVEAASAYLSSRRKLKKMVQKASFIRKKQNLGKGYEKRPVENLLMDAKSATLVMINSLFSYMMGTKAHSSEYLASKLMESKKVEQTEFTKVDAALISFMHNGDDDVTFDYLFEKHGIEHSDSRRRARMLVQTPDQNQSCPSQHS